MFKALCWVGCFFYSIKSVLEKAEKLGIIDSYSRLGIRYVNAFESNIFENINLTMMMKEKSLIPLDKTLRLEIQVKNCVHTLHIANSVKVENDDKVNSIIDIDTYIDNPEKDSIIDLIKAGHEEEKKLFFNLIKPDFLKTKFNPEY